MSFVTKFEGEVREVVGKIEAEAEKIVEPVAKRVHTAMSVLVKDIEAAFGKTMKEGKQLVVKIDSAGHFDPDGIGSATVIVTSKAVPADASTPVVDRVANPPSETPPSAPPAASTPVQP